MWNISHYSRGMMGYQTPNIDRVAKEGITFTDFLRPAVDWFVPRHADEVVKPCCGPAVNPRIASPAKSYDAAQAQFRIPRKVVKGGSHLCAPNYCLRYRPAARQPQMVDTSMNHIGFRCIAHQGTDGSVRNN